MELLGGSIAALRAYAVAHAVESYAGWNYPKHDEHAMTAAFVARFNRSARGGGIEEVSNLARTRLSPLALERVLELRESDYKPIRVRGHLRLPRVKMLIGALVLYFQPRDDEAGPMLSHGRAYRDAQILRGWIDATWRATSRAATRSYGERLRLLRLRFPDEVAQLLSPFGAVFLDPKTLEPTDRRPASRGRPRSPRTDAALALAGDLEELQPDSTRIQLVATLVSEFVGTCSDREVRRVIREARHLELGT